MSIAAALAQVQPVLQLFLFAAMLVHMAEHFDAIDCAPEPASDFPRDDIPLWPYAS